VSGPSQLRPLTQSIYSHSKVTQVASAHKSRSYTTYCVLQLYFGLYRYLRKLAVSCANTSLETFCVPIDLGMTQIRYNIKAFIAPPRLPLPENSEEVEEDLRERDKRIHFYARDILRTETLGISAVSMYLSLIIRSNTTCAVISRRDREHAFPGPATFSSIKLRARYLWCYRSC
jgi:hypothetical protein